MRLERAEQANKLHHGITRHDISIPQELRELVQLLMAIGLQVLRNGQGVLERLGERAPIMGLLGLRQPARL